MRLKFSGLLNYRMFLGIALCLLSVLAACWVAFLIAEKYFFAKLIYQKSCLHGYVLDNSFCDVLRKERLGDYHLLRQAVKASQLIPKTSYRVVLIGDSFFYGYGSRYGRTVAPVLEQKLKQHRATEVWNLSKPGDNVIDNYTKYLAAKQFLQPDLIVMSMVDNDLFLRSDEDLRYLELNEQSVYEDLVSDCPLPLFTTTQSELMNPDWNYLLYRIFLPSFSSQNGNVCLLREISRRMAEDQTVLWINLSMQPDSTQCMNYPDMTSIAEDYRTIFYDYSHVIQEQGNYVITTLDQGKEVFMPVDPVENHPSPKTHAWYAKLIEHELLTNPRWKY